MKKAILKKGKMSVRKRAASPASTARRATRTRTNTRTPQKTSGAAQKEKKVTRPWGGYQIIEKRKDYWIKKLFVTKGQRTSLQSHNHRAEVWVVLRGKVRAQIGTKETVFSVGDMCRVKQGEKHRIYGVTDAVVLEAAFGKPLEGDIIRYKDDYNRV